MFRPTQGTEYNPQAHLKKSSPHDQHYKHDELSVIFAFTTQIHDAQSVLVDKNESSSSLSVPII